ncbi:phosphotransferase [Paraflavitalea sp. CAU 1676]|uniref:phosphotransferase enzyme family protein n=1 Tax=Paraflavitalea sp. CAU 1676 TaxID=3032598 RepID=UPI0023D9D0B6|nr:phosphotransferase [Paraflavitalea sp. CAU 1676]MDF2188125.1 phosphotransferase [Paraflavitalea sp. CAU 1676]
MNIFPTQYSTLSAQALGNFVANQYNLKGATCQYLLRGVSDTYKIEGQGGKFILKIYRDMHRSLEQIKGEVELLNILKEGSARVSYPIADREGHQIQTFQAAEGTRYGVLFSYAEGKPSLKPTTEQIILTAREMARVHNISSSIKLSHTRPIYNYESILINPIQLLAPAFHELPDEYQYIQDTAQLVMNKLNSLHADTFAAGYCHYDFMPKNFHFGEENELTFFDFDFAGHGWLVNDLMTYWVHFALYTVMGRMTRDEADVAFDLFVNTYREYRPLSNEEVQAIPYLNFCFWIFYLGFHYENFDDFSTHFFNTGFLRERIALVKKIMIGYGVH